MNNNDLRDILRRTGLSRGLSEACSRPFKGKKVLSEGDGVATSVSPEVKPDPREIVKTLPDEVLMEVVRAMVVQLTDHVPEMEKKPRLAVEIVRALGRRLIMSRSLEAKVARQLKMRGSTATKRILRRALSKA